MSENITAYAGDLINTEDMTIAENLDRIINAKEAIKEAIVAKGGQVSEDARIDQYPAAIEALPSGEDNLEKLLAGTLTEIHSTTPVTYGYAMFNHNPSLEIADIVISDNITKSSQYYGMFQQCTKLTKAPDLPATTLRSTCYYNMFKDCTALTKAPDLPATTLATQCYYGMFNGCSSLTTVPEILPATTLADSCYQYMFSGCTALTQAPYLQATTMNNNSCQYMFDGCSSLTTAPELPATTLKTGCYYYMFRSCTALTKAPDLPATTLGTDCYTYMFQSCTALRRTGEIAAEGTGEIAAEGNVTSGYMFRDCTSLQETTWTATTPPTINASIWTGCPADMIIYVPDEAVEKYKTTTGWTARAAYIKPMSEKYISAELISQDEVVAKSFVTSASVNCTIRMTTSDGYEDIIKKQIIVKFDENLTDFPRTIPVPVELYGQTVTVMINQTAHDIPTIRNVEKYGTYGFELNDNGYYESKNYNATSSSSSYAYATVTFVPQSNTVTFECINTSNNIPSSCYGIISKLNQNLAKSTSRDTSTSLVQQSWYGVASSDTPVEVTYSGLNPGMSYRITVKYIKGNSTSTLNKFQFKVKGE